MSYGSWSGGIWLIKLDKTTGLRDYTRKYGESDLTNAVEDAYMGKKISGAVGGIPALTAAVVVCTGIFGGMAGFKIIKLTHVTSPIAQGLSMGTAAHAVGTSVAMERGERYGAFSSLGLTINGLLTALLTPFILQILNI